MPDIPLIPTLCDRCRTQGHAGHDPFEELADLLDFTPVPVRRHANNWTAEHQRAFVAAIAVTGNERAAARSIGRYTGGADRLRKSPRGKSFKEACDNALDLYRERELYMLKDSLTDLAKKHAEAEGEAKMIAAEMDYHREIDEPGHAPDPLAVEDARTRIADRLAAAKSLYLLCIMDDPEKRAAWETLCGKVDWDAVGRGEIEPVREPNMKSADMVITNHHIDPIEGLKLTDEQRAELMKPDAPAIEAEQAADGRRQRVADCREVDDAEVRARGFDYNGDAWIKRLSPRPGGAPRLTPTSEARRR